MGLEWLERWGLGREMGGERGGKRKQGEMRDERREASKGQLMRSGIGKKLLRKK